MEERIDRLAEEGLARRRGQRVILARDLLKTLRQRELEAVATKVSAEMRLPYRAAVEGEHIAGIYRQRVDLSSDRFAMIDDGLGFQLVPWRPALDRHLGTEITGIVMPGGQIDWSFGRKRGLSL